MNLIEKFSFVCISKNATYSLLVENTVTGQFFSVESQELTTVHRIVPSILIVANVRVKQGVMLCLGDSEDLERINRYMISDQIDPIDTEHESVFKYNNPVLIDNIPYNYYMIIKDTELGPR